MSNIKQLQQHIQGMSTPSQHLSGALLAELVAIEATGATWEARHPEAAQHINRCSRCARAFATLAADYDALLAEPDAETDKVRLWGRLLDWQRTFKNGWQHWLPRLRPLSATPTLSGQDDSQNRWLLFNQNVTFGLETLQIQVVALRENAEYCTLQVHARSFYPIDLSQLQLRIRLGEHWHSLTCDQNGQATLPHTHSQALSDWEIALQF